MGNDSESKVEKPAVEKTKVEKTKDVVDALEKQDKAKKQATANMTGVKDVMKRRLKRLQAQDEKAKKLSKKE